MFVDGLHALLMGSYFAPGGQIGPWAALLSTIGVPPFSAGVKVAFVVLGLAYIVAGLAYALYERRALWFGLVAVCTLWYLPLGTILSLIVLIAIAVSRTRHSELDSP